MATTKRAKTVTKKTTTTTSRRVSPKAETTPVTSPAVSESVNRPMAVRIKKPYVFTLAGLILLAALLYYFRSLFIVALVNGQPISRFSIIQQLEQQGGKQTLNIAVTKVLIEQEARKRNVTVSQSEIDAELKKVETSLATQGQTLDQGLAAAGMSRSQYLEQVKLQKLIDKMVGKDITVTEKDVDDYIETNKSQIPEGSDMTQIRNSVKDQLRQQKVSEKVQTWIAQLQKKR